MIFEHLDRIVFTGDSVTDMQRARPVGEGLFDNLGHGYVRVIDNMLNAWYPECAIRISNTGTDGNTSRDLKARFQTDVIDLNPDWVSICIGINDVWRQFDSPSLIDSHVYTEEYETNLEEMIVSVKDQVKGIIIMSPYYMEPNKNDPMRKCMDQYVSICKRLAEKHTCRFIDLQAVFDEYFNYRHSTYIAWDRVHPNQVGATVIAKAFLEACEFEFFK